MRLHSYQHGLFSSRLFIVLLGLFSVHPIFGAENSCVYTSAGTYDIGASCAAVSNVGVKINPTGSSSLNLINNGTISDVYQAINITGGASSSSPTVVGDIINGANGTLASTITDNAASSGIFVRDGYVNIGSIINIGSIESAGFRGSSNTVTAGIQLLTTENATSVALILNKGVISSGASGSGIFNQTNITTITNAGTISAGGPTSQGFYGIKNFSTTVGTVGTLNNAQGVGNANGALTYYGKLPTNYNIITADSTHYGQLNATSASGAMTFGIFGGSTYTAADGNAYTVSASTLAVGTYSDVLQGLTGT